MNLLEKPLELGHNGISCILHNRRRGIAEHNLVLLLTEWAIDVSVQQ